MFTKLSFHILSIVVIPLIAVTGACSKGLGRHSDGIDYASCTKSVRGKELFIGTAACLSSLPAQDWKDIG